MFSVWFFVFGESAKHHTLNTKYNIQFFGGDSKEVTPVPIPNTEVKLFCADGTAWETKWESRTLPEIFHQPGINHKLIVVIPGFFISKSILHKILLLKVSLKF